MKVEGRCHCGQITYTAIIDPERVTVCHCSDCQMLSGSAYRASVPAPDSTFESGNKRAHAFCPECGAPIYSAAISDPPTFSLRVGGLDQRAELRPRRQIWCRSALDWSTNLEGIERHSRQ